eukprot:2285645-Amphidinium_carterae.2
MSQGQPASLCSFRCPHVDRHRCDSFPLAQPSFPSMPVPSEDVNARSGNGRLRPATPALCRITSSLASLLLLLLLLLGQ